MTEDTRTLAQLAQEAIDIQNACNLSGLVHGWSRSISRLRKLCPDLDTNGINRHPINFLWADKLADLAGVSGAIMAYSDAMDSCTLLAKGDK